MSDELLTIILATLIGLVPNLAIKWLEKQKPKEDLAKTSMESADLSLEMLTDANKTLVEHIKFQDERLLRKREELECLQLKYDALLKEYQDYKKEKENAIRS